MFEVNHIVPCTKKKVVKKALIKVGIRIMQFVLDWGTMLGGATMTPKGVY
jgi:hypothetical protein